MIRKAVAFLGAFLLFQTAISAQVVYGETIRVQAYAQPYAYPSYFANVSDNAVSDSISDKSITTTTSPISNPFQTETTPFDVSGDFEQLNTTTSSPDISTTTTSPLTTTTSPLTTTTFDCRIVVNNEDPTICNKYRAEAERCCEDAGGVLDDLCFCCINCGVSTTTTPLTTTTPTVSTTSCGSECECYYLACQRGDEYSCAQYADKCGDNLSTTTTPLTTTTTPLTTTTPVTTTTPIETETCCEETI